MIKEYFNSHLIHILLSASRNFMDFDQIRKLMRKHLPHLTLIDMQFQRLNGLANLTYAVIIEGQPTYVFKKHCSDAKRKLEHQILVGCSEAGIGPKCIYFSQQYQILQYIKNSRCLLNKQMLKEPFLSKIMNKMHRFHSINILQVKLQGKHNTSRYLFSDEQYQKILEQGKKSQKNKGFEALYKKIMTVLNKRQYYSQLLLPQNDSSIKICHQDLFNSNILVSNQEIFFVDFQFANFNYLAFDIANYINQSGIDYSQNKYPGFELIATYSAEDIYKIAQQYPGFYPELGLQVLKCMCVVNLFWAIGSIMNADYDLLPTFDIVKSGITKMGLFELYENIIAQQLQKK